MNLGIRRRLWLLASTMGLLLSSSIAVACSCSSPVLATRFETNDNVFSALITGGHMIEEIPTEERRHVAPRLKMTFQVTESFKGRIPFEYLSGHVGGSMCGTSLRVGVEYLIFASDTGKVGLCSGILPVSGLPDDEELMAGKRYASALRSFTSGDGDLSSPWFFRSFDRSCQIWNAFPYHGDNRHFPASLQINYRQHPPSGTRAEQSQSDASFANLSIRVPGREDLSRFPMSLRAQDKEYVAHWKNSEYSFGYYWLEGDDVVSFITELEHANAIYIRSTHPRSGEIDAEVSTSNAGDSLARMSDCLPP